MYNDKWVFFQLPDKPAISAEDVKYWTTNLQKILKVGLEFEFNLPNAKGFCRGISKSCPCVNMHADNTCWQKCLNEDICKEEFKDSFEETCANQLCSNFQSACLTCTQFKSDCIDCTYRYDPKYDPDSIREYLRDRLGQSKSYGTVNPSGVHSVVCDGSLLGKGREGKGAEIVTIGRRMDYWEFFNMSDSIIKKSIKKGAYVNERCSTHVHLLASYYDVREGGRGGNGLSELERPLPQIVMANFHQLCRRYQNAITWMSMALSNEDHLTRWEKYRVSVLNTSPVTNSMQRVIQELADMSGKSGGKYGWVNYMFTQFNNDCDVTRFHVEMRALDGMMSASVVTALSSLFYALVIKAVEISKYGLLEIGSKEWVAQTKDIKSRLMNNTSGWNDGDRFSNNSGMTKEDKQFLCVESLDLINQLKHILLKLGPAYEVLEKLAEKPVAFYRCEGVSWEDIEKTFAAYRPEETILEQKLSEIIDFRTVTRCEDEDIWTTKVGTMLEKDGITSVEQLTQMVNMYKRNGMFIWSENLGTILKV